ncbi:MAG TPA: lysophospholipid acyltransferase family protein, partial [Hyphomicrobium sp.]|nr:lysophospholipid acyltransferase family protein [Hyphomicrobium sp.]
RASAILTGFFALTVPLMPVQAVLVRVSPKAARRFPNWYHRQVCRLMGITLNIEGSVAHDVPVLLVCNHTSWLDIPVLSALAPLSFVAKKEVGGWPFVASLARLQRTVFIDRNKRQAAGDAADEISGRLASGDTIVLFAEGTSSDGNRVLPFKTLLFSAVKGGSPSPSKAVVQTAAVVYTHVHGVPLLRADRPRVAWFGDMEMQSHAWGVLKGGPLSVTIRVSPPVPLETFVGRKDLALTSERTVRKAVLGILRGRPEDDIQPVEPDETRRRLRLPTATISNEKWT